MLWWYFQCDVGLLVSGISKAVYIGTDHGGGVLIKMTFFWDQDEKKVIKLNLDFDTSGHTAIDGGKAIKHSISKYLVVDGASFTFKGGSSDSGGGFTNVAMKNCLLEQELVNENDYIHVPCTEHNDQTNLRRATEDVYGTGGLDARNLLQLLHAFAYAQQQFETDFEVKELFRQVYKWKHEDEEPPNKFLLKMQEPILTRWKTVGDSANFQQEYFDEVKEGCISIGKSRSYQGSSKIGQAAANYLSLAKEKEIAVDLFSFLISIPYILHLILISTGSQIHMLVLLVSMLLTILCVTLSKSKI